MKAYQEIEIVECGEPLVPIPLEEFAVELPHPYEKLGANYGKYSPYSLRKGVLQALKKAQSMLDVYNQGWKLKIYDAYRPVGVQQFMVNHTFTSLMKKNGWNQYTMSPQQEQSLWHQVYQMWAAPSLEPNTPPPHSTGGAIDLTLVNDRQETVEMGGEFDEISARSHPYYYMNVEDPQKQEYHNNREILNRAMTRVGFCRHPQEWWHFSLGDQMWAYLQNQENTEELSVARYGRI